MVYLWADGIYINAREADRRCVLVLIGCDAHGNKHFLAIDEGFRESTESWKALLLGLRVRYFPASSLVQELQVAKQGLYLSETLRKLDKYRLLIIDDIGYVKRSEAETSVLFELIAHRYESGSLLITSNHPFSA